MTLLKKQSLSFGIGRISWATPHCPNTWACSHAHAWGIVFSHDCDVNTKTSQHWPGKSVRERWWCRQARPLGDSDECSGLPRSQVRTCPSKMPAIPVLCTFADFSPIHFIAYAFQGPEIVCKSMLMEVFRVGFERKISISPLSCSSPWLREPWW